MFGGQDCIQTPFGEICISDFPTVTRSLGGLTRYNLADSNVRNIPASTDAIAPAHDPASDRVIYLSPDGLGHHPQCRERPRPRPWSTQSALGPAVFRPDGQFIYTTRRSGDHWDIWRYRADGSGEMALTAPPGLRDFPIHSVAPTPSPRRQIDPVSSPIVRGGKWELWRMNSDGGNPQPFAPAALSEESNSSMILPMNGWRIGDR